MSEFLNDKRVLITGGTGTLGHAIVKRALDEGWNCRLTVYSRSECLQAEMRAEYPQISYVVGDVRDAPRLRAAVAGHDVVFHLAAMKRIPECEEQPYECWQTNVIGSQNVVDACNVNHVCLCIGISTDKACQPVTMYGASKLAMEKIFQAQQNRACRFVLARYGNVIESRGSVILLWRRQVAQGQLPTITDSSMTRFWITPRQAVDVVLETMRLQSGEIYAPKMKALPITEMALHATGEARYTEIGLRSAERLHEWVVSPDERADDFDDHYVLRTSGTFGHRYCSLDVPRLSPGEFRAMMEEVNL